MAATTTTTTARKSAPKSGTVVKSLKAGAFDAIRDAFSTSVDTEIRRTMVIRAAIDNGFTQREFLAAVAKANGGMPLMSKGTAGRYWIVATHAFRDDLPKTTDAQGKRAILAIVTLANYGTAADVAAAVDVAAKGSKTGASFATALDAAAKAAGKSEYKALTAPRNTGTRPVKGTADAKGTPAAQSAPTSAPANAAADARAALRASTVGALIAELTRRTTVRGFSADAVQMAAFDNLAAAWETATADAQVTADA